MKREQSGEPVVGDEALFGWLHSLAVGSRRSTLHGIFDVGTAALTAVVLFAANRPYLVLPLLSAVCFAVYGLTAQRSGMFESTGGGDDARAPDTTIITKVAAFVGVATGVGTLLSLFLFVLGPSWSH